MHVETEDDYQLATNR